MSTQNHFSFNAFDEYAAASQVHPAQPPVAAVAVVDEKKKKKRGGRKSLWETDYDAAVKRQWDRVLRDLPKGGKKLRAVPLKLEVVALLDANGKTLKKYTAVIRDAHQPLPPPKAAAAKGAKESKEPKKRGGRKSLWETDPEGAAARELDRWLAKVPTEKGVHAPPRKPTTRKRGRVEAEVDIKSDMERLVLELREAQQRLDELMKTK